MERSNPISVVLPEVLDDRGGAFQRRSPHVHGPTVRDAEVLAEGGGDA